MPWTNGRWTVPVVVCALAFACATEDQGNVDDPSTSHGGGSSSGNGGGGSSSTPTGGSTTGGTTTLGGSAGSTAGTAGSTAGTGGDGTSVGGAGGDATGEGGDATNAGGAGGDATSNGGAGGGGAAVGGAGGESSAAGAGSGGDGGAGGASCDDGTRNGTESHVDCGDSADLCGDCAFPLSRYVIGSGPSMGTVTMTWDATNLYFDFAIVDATPFDDSSLHYLDDSVEIYLDINNGKTTSYQADDRQFTIARSGTDIQGNNSVSVGVVVGRTSDAAGYTLDVTIPWASMNVVSAPLEEEIGFDFAINDDTDGGDSRERQVMVFGAINNHENTSAWGTIKLN
jgi:hypothetical protein